MNTGCLHASHKRTGILSFTESYSQTDYTASQHLSEGCISGIDTLLSARTSRGCAWDPVVWCTICRVIPVLTECTASILVSIKLEGCHHDESLLTVSPAKQFPKTIFYRISNSSNCINNLRHNRLCCCISLISVQSFIESSKSVLEISHSFSVFPGIS